MSTNPEYIFIIYTYKKNLHVANKTYDLFVIPIIKLLENYKIKVLIMYGNNNIKNSYKLIKDRCLVIKSPDDYINLHIKTIRLMNTISNVYPNIKGLFKCDDDIIINFKSIIQFINIINQKQHIIDYAGKVVQLPYIEDNSKHFKQFKKINIESFSTPESIYCGGPLYYLSNAALKCFKNIL